MAGVVSACVAGGIVERGSQIIYDFAFAFVAPLGAHHDDRFRSDSLRHSCSHSSPGRTLPAQSENLSATGGLARLTAKYNPPPRLRPNASLAGQSATSVHQVWAFRMFGRSRLNDVSSKSS